MSINNFYTDGYKGYQNLNVNSISTEDVNTQSLEFNTIQTETMSGKFAQMEKTGLSLAGGIAQDIVSYNNISGSLTGFNQTSGTFTAQSLGLYGITVWLISTDGLEPATSYYLKVNRSGGIELIGTNILTFAGPGSIKGAFQQNFLLEMTQGESILINLRATASIGAITFAFKVFKIY